MHKIFFKLFESGIPFPVWIFKLPRKSDQDCRNDFLKCHWPDITIDQTNYVVAWGDDAEKQILNVLQRTNKVTEIICFTDPKNSYSIDSEGDLNRFCSND